MPFTRPGVYVTETPLRSSVPLPNTATVAAFFGTSDRGPTTPTYVDSWSAYKSLFGDLGPSHDLGYAVYQYFANGGRASYISRVAGASATAASSASVTYVASTGASTPVRLFNTFAKNVGTWGNSLSIALSAGRVAATATVFPTFNMSIKLSGSEVEYWSELSVDPADSRYVLSVINEYSNYITLSNMASVTKAAGLSFSTNEVTLASGSNGLAIAGSDYVSALSGLDTIEGTLLINLVGRSDATSVNGATTYASGRGNSFVIIDPDPTLTSSTSINQILSTYTDTGYGAVYYPMVKIIDPTKTGPAAVRTSYPGGAIAGVYVRTDTERSVAKTPAGYGVDLRNVLGLSFNPSDALVTATYDNGANYLKAVPGAGVVVLGGRTLQPLKPDKYIAVRRTLNYIKQGIADISEFALFEPNSPLLWDSLSTQVTKFLTTLWGAGGLKGQAASEAFYVVCNSTNNTVSTIDDGAVNIEVGVSLLYPAEFIVINVSQWAGGTNTLESF